MKFNNYFEELLFKLCPEDLKLNQNNNLKLPSLYHCVGTNKLLGQYYGDAISYELALSLEETQYINSLSCLIRAFIVLDDFTKDNYISENNISLIKDWIKSIQEKIIEILVLLEKNVLIANFLWSKYFKIYENSFNNFKKNNLYNSILSKCGICFLPFELSLISNSPEKLNLIHIIEDYLFSLQLLDDFQDMEEDINSPKNHNLFLCQNKKDQYALIYQNRIIFHNPLFDLIINNLSRYLNYNNPFISKYITNSINWLKERKIDFYSINQLFFKNELKKFEFKIQNFDIQNLNGISNFYDYTEIRAENMHTI